MVERSSVGLIETAEPIFRGGEMTYLQCTALGWSDLEIERFSGMNPGKVKETIVDKMLTDLAYERRLARLSRLPFVSESFLSPTQGMVAFLAQSGFRNVDIARTTGLDQANISTYKKKIEKKKSLGRDRDIPPIVHGRKAQRVGLVRALHTVIVDELIDVSLIQNQPSKPLSFSESRTLLYMCWGLDIGEISGLTSDNASTIEVFYKRGKKKLGVGKINEYVARGIMEIIRLTTE